MEFLMLLCPKILEQLFAISVEKGINIFSEKILPDTLQEIDNAIRLELADNVSEEQYQKLDTFFKEEGLFGMDRLNPDIIEKISTPVAKDFFHKHPKLSYDKETLEPKIKAIVEKIYHSIINKLSLEGRLIYSQQLKQSNQLNEILEYLKATKNGSKISHEKAKEIYELLIAEFDKGNFEIPTTILDVLEGQLDSSDAFLFTSCKIRQQYYFSDSKEVVNLCKKFIQETPSSDILQETTEFLTRVNEIEGLKIVHVFLDNSPLKYLAETMIKNNPYDVWDMLIQDNHEIKDEYKDQEYALWVIANTAGQLGNKGQAYIIYEIIEKQHPTIWVCWAKCCSQANIVASQIIFCSSLYLDQLREILKRMFDFSNLFSKMNDRHKTNYAQEILNTARVLPLSEFNFIWDKLPLEMRELPSSLETWYMAHCPTWKNVDDHALKEFCHTHNSDNAWALYLYCRAKDDPSFVLKEINENPITVFKNVNAISAYAIALTLTENIETALNKFEEIELSPDFIVLQSIILAEISEEYNSNKKDFYLENAYAKIMQTNHPVYIVCIPNLVNLFLKRNLWEKASLILEKFQDIEPSLKRLRLQILISHKETHEICEELIISLKELFKDDPELLYYEGCIEENKMPGLGLSFLEVSFSIFPKPETAHAILVSRIKCRIFEEDDIFRYALRQDNIALQCACGIIYNTNEKPEESKRCYLQALLLCNDKYDEELFKLYVVQQLEKQNHTVNIDKIAPDMCVILRETTTASIEKIWIHNDSIRIPKSGSTFAGYRHISATTPEALRLLGLQKQDSIFISGQSYTIESINLGDIIAATYCMKQLSINGGFQKIEFNEDNPIEIFEKIEEIMRPYNEQLNETLETYRNEPGKLTLSILVHNIGKPYFHTLQLLCMDTTMPLWAGWDGDILTEKCILSPSTIAILAALKISPSVQNNSELELYITKTTKKEIELQVKDFMHDQSAGAIGIGPNGKAFLIENTPESKYISKEYYISLLEWAKETNLCRDTLAHEYSDELKQLVKAIGLSDAEGITIANKDEFNVYSEDIVLRRYMTHLGIKNATVISVIISLGLKPKIVLNHVNQLLDWNYQSPCTNEFLRWLSIQFSNCSDEEELTELTVQTIDIIKKIIANEQSRNSLVYAVRKLKEEHFIFNETLWWLISTNYQLFLLENQQP